VIGPVVALAAVLLRPGGALGIEHDDGQGEAVPALLARYGAFAGIADHLDLAGRPRFATAVRAGGGPSGKLACRDALRLPAAD
jgi:release factor glutamine methyltransferase